MTAPPRPADQETPEAPSPVPTPTAGRPRRWQPWALAAICLFAAVLYGWGSWGTDWGNTFYTAAVKSMSESFSNFIFGSFDPAGVVTVDKPPAALWPQVISVLVFGFHPWSVLLPQVLEGAAAVFLLHRAVRIWAGEKVALLSALILAVTPVTVAINHDNNPDTLLVLFSVAAAYALTRAITADVVARSRTKWLLLCAFLLGCAFVTKMLAGWIVVPGFAVAYLLADTGTWRRKLFDLLGATGVLLVSSFWWPLLHDLWPGAKPYMDNSTNGTAFNLIFAYNGFGRIFGQGGPGGGGVVGGAALPAAAKLPAGVRGGGGFAMFGGGTGLGRMFSGQVGGQISWLLPFTTLVLLVVLVAGALRWRAKQPARHAERAGWMLWGSWLVVTFVVFSYAQGIWHPYYTTMLAPPIAALTAAGLRELWRYYRRPGGFSWLLLPLGVAVPVAWAFVLVERDTSWNGWAGSAVLAVGGVAVVALVVARLPKVTAPVVGRVGVALGAVALLLVPAVWSSGTAFAGTSFGGVMPSAGPPGGAFGPGGLSAALAEMAGRGGARPGGVGGGRPGGFPGGGLIPVQAAGGGQFPGGRGGARGGFGGGGTLTAEQRKILDYVVKNAPNARIKLAIEGGSQASSAWIIGSDVTVIGMGGFMGSDDAPSVNQLATWTSDGQLRFVLGSGPAGGTPGGRAGGGGFGRGGTAATARNTWVQKNCTVVPPSAYGGTGQQSGGGDGGGFPGPGGGTQTLYRCGG